MATWNSNGADTGTNSVQDYITNHAATGDIVTIPSGGFTWNTGVTINKAITLQGAGQGLTTITKNNGTTAVIAISGLTGADVTHVTRVTGIFFENTVAGQTMSGRQPDISITNNVDNSGTGWTNIRIDNCTFHLGMMGVYWSGWAYGVVDHCTFNDCLNSVFCDGKGASDQGDQAWARNDYTAGLGNFPFIEDCQFNWTNATNAVAPHGPGSPWAIFTQQGGRWVARHCNFDSHTNNLSGGIEGIIDFHGNNNYWNNNVGNGGDFRSSIRMEFYQNTVHSNMSFRNMDLRGGSSIIWGNTFIQDTWNPNICDYREEEDDPATPSLGGNVRTGSELHWPAEDQVSASFIWNNTVTNNGVAQTPTVGVGTFGNKMTNYDQSIFIFPNRDFWLKPPDNTTSTNYNIQPAAPPSSASYPMPYNNSSYVTTSYMAYPYPHRLVQAGPNITSLSTNTGTAAGGTSVTITGTGFTNASAVYFGNTTGTITATSGDTSITVTSPAYLAVPVDITVHVGTAVSPIVSADKFTFSSTGAQPAITSISPTSGTLAGGTSVTITGTGFTGVSDVLFGTTAATSYVVNTDVTITAVAPSVVSAGAVDIRLKLPTALGSGDQFAYTSGTTKQVKQSKGGNMSADGTSTTITYGSAVSSGSLLAVAVNIVVVSVTITGVQDNVNGAGKPWSKAIASGSSPRSEIWYLPNSGAGTPVVTITFSGTVQTSEEDMYIYEVSNCATSSPLDGTNSNSGTSTTPSSGTITTTNANDFILSAIATNGDASAVSPFTGLNNPNANGDLSEYEVVTTTQTNLAATYSQASASYVAVIAAFK